MKKTVNSLLLKKLVFSPAMIVFITNVDISNRSDFFNLKQTISPWYGIVNVISSVIARKDIYIPMCNTCEWFYLEQANNLKQRIIKHKSDVFHPQNSFCKKCSEHLRDCRRMKEHLKNLFLEYTHFDMRIKRNYTSSKKTFHYEMETTFQYLAKNC